MDKRVTRISAYGLLVRENKMLLCRLSQRVMKSAGHWTLPGGGLDFGESPENAVVREFREETGLIVETGSLVTIDTMFDEVNGTQFHSIRIIYEANYVCGELAFEEHGSTDLCEWFSESDARALPLVSLAQNGIGYAFA